MKTSGIKRGDLIYFHYDEENTLTLITSNNLISGTSTETIEVYADLCTDPNMLAKIIVANYNLGRDVIKIVSKNRLTSDFVDAIRETVQKLIGIAIMEETPNQVILQSSIDISQFSINTLI